MYPMKVLDESNCRFMLSADLENTVAKPQEYDLVASVLLRAIEDILFPGEQKTAALQWINWKGKKWKQSFTFIETCEILSINADDTRDAINRLADWTLEYRQQHNDFKHKILIEDTPFNYASASPPKRKYNRQPKSVPQLKPPYQRR